MAKNDKTAPKLISIYPNKGSSDVALNQPLILKFNEDIQVGLGNIVISNGSDIRKIPLTPTLGSSAQVSITGKLLTLRLTDNLLPNSLYSVKIENTAIEDLSGNKYLGINNATTYYFNTLDNLNPTLAKSSPLANSSNFSINSNLVLTFNEKIKTGAGNITLVSSSDSRTISVTDSQVKISGNTLTINPTMDLNTNSTYKLNIAAGVIKDVASTPNSNDPLEFTFTTKSTGDKQAPLLQSRFLNGSSKDNLQLVFQEAIKIGSGNFTLSDGSNSVMIPVTDPQISIANNVLTINPAKDLDAEKIYTLTAPKGIVTDLANNAFLGLTTKAPFTFDTRDQTPPTLTITDDKNTTTNSKILYTFSSSEPIEDFNIDDISVKGGTKGEFKPVSGTNSFTLSVLPNPNSIESITINIPQGTFSDLIGNKNLAVEQDTQSIDTLCPLLIGSTPTDDSSYFSTTGNIVLIFDENIFKGTGNFVISNGSDVQTIPVNDDKQVVINNKIVTINPARDLMTKSNYSLTFSPGVLTDKVGNNFAGLVSPTQLNFNTGGISSISKDSVSQAQTFIDKLNGKALDGYLKNATVFADANGDGVQNSDEATAITDEYGNFELVNAKGTIVVSGGTDLSTGNPFEGTLKAPEGSTVVTPLTTMLQGFIDEKQTLAEAKKSVANAFSFDAAVNLMSYDPIAGMVNSADTASTQIMSSSAQIANFLVTAGRVLQGAAGDNGNLSPQNASDALIKSFVNVVKTGDGAVNMNDGTLLKAVLVNGAKEANIQAQASGLPPKFDPTNFTDKIGKMADTVTAVLKDAADNIINAVNKGNAAEPLALLTNMDKISTFTQNDAGKSLQEIAVGLDTKNDVAVQKILQNQVNLLTGLPAAQAIQNNIVQTANTVPDILAVDKAIKNAPTQGTNPGTNNPGAPGTNPGINNPGTPGTDPNNPGTPGTNPGTTNPGASGTDPNNPGAPGTTNPGTPGANPGTNNPGAPGTNPRINNPGTPGTDPNNPGTPGTNPGTTNPGTPGANPGTNNPGASGADPNINTPSAPGTNQVPDNHNAPSTENVDNPSVQAPSLAPPVALIGIPDIHI